MKKMKESDLKRVIAICGVKNSGKTTLITGLTKSLTCKGYKVAVIKHDGHDFDCDVPGTDSWQYIQSGAYGAVCFSQNRLFVHKVIQNTTAEQLVSLFPEADVIFVEGLKDSSLDKIEIVRQDVSDDLVSNPEGRFLIVSDVPGFCPGCETASPDDIEGIAKAIINKRRKP